MDVVRANIDQIGGTIDVKSAVGRGTSITVKIPLTLAIVSALIVEAGGERFAIPQLAVVELVRVRAATRSIASSASRTRRCCGCATSCCRSSASRRCSRSMTAGDGDAGNGFIVVTQVGSQTFGIVVDGVFHTEEIVVKPMSSKLRHIPMFSGNTILGDGSVILIIDPNGVAQTIGTATATAPGRLKASATAQRQARKRDRIAARVPRRLAAAEGCAALAGHPARGDRRREDRALQRPSAGAVPRPAHAAHPGQRRGARQGERRSAAAGVLGRRPPHGVCWSTRSSTSSRTRLEIELASAAAGHSSARR